MSTESLRPIQTLETAMPDVHLRPFTPEERPDVEHLFDKNKATFVRGGIWPERDTIMNILDGNSELSDEIFGIWSKNKLVGYISAGKSDESISEVEVGYGIDEMHVKKGIATAALKALSEYEVGRGNDLVADVDYTNQGSARALEKAGFMLEMEGRGGRQVYRKLSLTEENLMRRLGI